MSLLFLAGCGAGTNQSLNTNGSNPAPTITAISPNTSAAGGAAFTLTITGTNFIAASIVNFGGTAPATTFTSATQLTASIPAAVIASIGTAAVTVTNPAPGGGTSNTVSFTITGGTNPVPTISALSPSCAPVGGQAFTLFAYGSNFVASSVVRWNGSDRPTAFDNSINGPVLIAQIPASDIAATGTDAVTVFNPAPSGGSSNSLNLTIFTGGVLPQSIALDPAGKFAYVANQGCLDAFAGNVSMYTIDPTTGALTSIGSPVSADFGPDSVTVGPLGKFAYVANLGNEGDVSVGSVSMYTVNATTGALTLTGTIQGVCGTSLCAPSSVVVDPTGKFAYVANEGGFAPTSVSIFAIDTTTGALTSMGTIAAGGRAVSVAVDPTGKFAYVTNSSNSSPGQSNSVSMYARNATTGALTSIGTIAAGTDPASVAADPTGKFAYVTNSGSNDVSIYTINATTGALTSIGTIVAGTGPASVAIDPTGKFAYVTNSGSNDVSMYTINVTTGVLKSMGTIAAGSTPTSIAIHPSGSFAYVTNSGSNSVSMYTIDAANGTLTLVRTVGT